MNSLRQPGPIGVPSAVRYIKLGPGGAWQDRCIAEGILELGHAAIPHSLAKTFDWDAVATAYRSQGLGLAKASDFTRELREFYTLPESTLWITTARGRLWWAYAAAAVEPLSAEGRGSRIRRTIGAWRDTDATGAPLLLDRLSSRLTSVAAYRQTLCRVREADYLLRRLNGVPEPAVARAQQAQQDLKAAAVELVQGLHWRDFEALIDLIFANSGWRRVSPIGGSDQVDSDMVLEQVVTNERAMVQVKSSADQTTVADYLERFEAGRWDRCFFVCHTSRSPLLEPSRPGFYVWQVDVVAAKAVEGGLVPWLISRAQ